MFGVGCVGEKTVKKGAATRPEVEEASSRAEIEGGNLFAREVYGHLAARNEGNLFFSPLSIRSCISMIYAGAGGRTAREIAETMHFRLPGEKLLPQVAQVLRRLTTLPDDKANRNPDYRLNVANGLWGQKRFPFRPEFVELVEKTCGATLKEMDFDKKDEACGVINEWVATQTRGMIQKAISPDELDDQTSLVLTNTIYLKGRWAWPFDEEATRKEEFTLSGGKVTKAPMMHQMHVFYFAENDDVQVLFLPYREPSGFYMVLLLPKKVGGLAKVEKSLVSGELDPLLKTCEVGYAALVAARRSKEEEERFHGAGGIDQFMAQVDVSIPRFRFAMHRDLKDILRSLGMVQAFDSSKADFSGISQVLGLWLDTVLHSAKVAVDEKGTEAAAATSGSSIFGELELKRNVIFKADHPFIFLICHKPTGAVIFMGRVADPMVEGDSR
jgi:serpin B